MARVKGPPRAIDKSPRDLPPFERSVEQWVISGRDWKALMVSNVRILVAVIYEAKWCKINYYEINIIRVERRRKNKFTAVQFLYVGVIFTWACKTYGFMAVLKKK